MARSKAKVVEPEGLGDFEGTPVEGVKIIVTRAGDGLSEAMPVAPLVLHSGDTGYIVLKFKATKIRFDPRKPRKDELEEDMGVDRVQVLEAQAAAFIDEDLVGDTLSKMAERIAAYRAEQKRKADEAKGIFTLDTVRGDPEDDF